MNTHNPPMGIVAITGNRTDKRSFADRMADPQTPEDMATAKNYRANIERLGRSWAAELSRLKQRANYR